MFRIARMVAQKAGKIPENSPASPRRTFLKNTLLALGAVFSVRRLASGETVHAQRWKMIIDRNRCTGCQSCVVACKAQNRSAEHRFNTAVKKTELPNGRFIFEPSLCNHCENPPCVAACPRGATTKLENGIVANDWSRCTAEGACVAACPYGARYLDPRFGQKVDKCDFCLDRLGKGLAPACVEGCPPRARLFGDAAAPTGEFASYLKRTDLKPRRPELGLTTRVLYAPVEGEKGARR